MIESVSHRNFLFLAGIVFMLIGSGFFGCTSTPNGYGNASYKVESPAPTAPPGASQGQEEVPSNELPPGNVESAQTAISSALPQQGQESQSLSPEKVPTLRTIGLFDGFVFSVPNPRVWWKVDPEGTPVRIELSKEQGFAQENILWAETSPKDQVKLPDLLEGKEYYLRIGVFQNNTMLKETILTYTVSYKSFSVPMLPILKPGASATFTMGYNGGLDREKPEHTIVLTRPYALGTYEVTNEEFVYVMNQLLKGGFVHWEGKNLIGPGRILLAGSQSLDFGTQFGFEEKDGLLVPIQGREKHPVVGVSWYGALAFCYYLSLMEGLEPCLSFDPSDPRNTITLRWDAEGYRLPTEAEWEYAARGEKGFLYPGGVLNPNGANFYRSGDPFEGYRTITETGGPTTPVGYFDGSLRGRYRTSSGVGPFGHFDLLGNVWEWCSDWFDPLYYKKSPNENPIGPESGAERIVRGGAWNTLKQDLRFTLRGFFPPEGTSYSIGFRLARTLKGEDK
ncbi:MAG: formylglycine-generating enzyme family protein [Spirochaetes bacterium]|nr:formylglycine-generating enzyme family protein [Spirochaetota bacterium]